MFRYFGLIIYLMSIVFHGDHDSITRNGLGEFQRISTAMPAMLKLAEVMIQFHSYYLKL